MLKQLKLISRYTILTDMQTCVIVTRVATCFALCRWILPARYKSVEGEICLVTGAGNGIGRLLAIEFAQRKAKLILWDIDKRGKKRCVD